MWPQAVVLVRRLHDIDMTGWLVTVFWALPAALILGHASVPSGTGTVAAWLGAVAVGLIPGARDTNRYGSGPRGKGIGTTA